MNPSEARTPKKIFKKILRFLDYAQPYSNSLFMEQDILIVEEALAELEELKKRDTKILELLVELLNKQMLGQEGLVLINRIKNLLSWSDKDE